ncbi:MAG: MaoC family dehydratase [Lachnospiraceae bacterium]|jgi:3-hydroxybutyryl-CoA dehydratase|nr:MaoC family dehydratase [Lachnospiraceae bacterium]
MKSYTIQELREGLTVQEEFPVTEQMGIEFAGVSGDTNPVHLNQDYAAATRFGAKIAHGMLIGSFISNVIGTRMPGEGSIYMKQEMTFLRPVYYGDRVTVEVAVKALQKDRNRAVLSTDCYNQKGEKVLAGEALVMPKEEK